MNLNVPLEPTREEAIERWKIRKEQDAGGSSAESGGNFLKDMGKVLLWILGIGAGLAGAGCLVCLFAFLISSC